MTSITTVRGPFSVLSGRSQRLPGYYQYFQGAKCLAQGHNTAEVGFETPTSRSGVCGYTTEPPFSPELPCRDYSNEHLHHMSSLIGNLFFAYAKTKTQITCNSFGYMIVQSIFILSGARGPVFQPQDRHVVSLSNTLKAFQSTGKYPGSSGSVSTRLKN